MGDNKEEEEKEAEEEERSARLIEDNTSEVLNDLNLEETSQDLIVNPETEVIDLEVERRTFEEVSPTTTSATTTTAAATMTPTASIVEKVKEELGEAPKITLEEDVLVVKSEGEDETIIAVPVKKIQQLIDALEVLKVFFV